MMNHSFMSAPIHRRGIAMVVVIWAIAVCSVLTASLMVFSMRQGMLGVEVQDRISARWAARAGLESTIAKMAEYSMYPIQDDALSLYYEMEDVSAGETETGSWLIQHSADDMSQQWRGPMDEHSKLNVNDDELRGLIAIMFYPLAFGVLDSITDWLDDDDEPSALGVERDWYLSLDARYEPRNGPIWHIAEMELIAGLEPEDIRGEDWNLNYRRDVSENDGDETLPVDEPDDKLDAGWSEFLTARSRGGGMADSGQPKLWLDAADPLDLISRCGITLEQAQYLVNKAQDDDFKLSDLILENRPAALNNTNSIFQQNETANTGQASFSPEEVAAVLSEVTLSPNHRPDWGKININTVPAKLLYEIFQDDERMVQDILAMRAARSEGISSLMSLWELPSMDEAQMEQMLSLFTTQSNVFTVVSRGKSKSSGQEVEIIAVVDRSTIPIRIIEYRED
ncbi:MAG: general secretion pathway protein GspK [Phycisphaerales bacterium]|nr:general secretion pathway protein GspK [Phycisphaerales bacterium]